jgi:hypothetical protein
MDKKQWQEQQSWARYEERFWKFFTDPVAVSPRAIAAAHRQKEARPPKQQK